MDPQTEAQRVRCLDCEEPSRELLCGPCGAVASALGYTAQERLDAILLKAD